MSAITSTSTARPSSPALDQAQTTRAQKAGSASHATARKAARPASRAAPCQLATRASRWSPSVGGAPPDPPMGAGRLGAARRSARFAPRYDVPTRDPLAERFGRGPSRNRFAVRRSSTRWRALARPSDRDRGSAFLDHRVAARRPQPAFGRAFRDLGISCALQPEGLREAVDKRVGAQRAPAETEPQSRDGPPPSWLDGKLNARRR